MPLPNRTTLLESLLTRRDALRLGAGTALTTLLPGEALSYGSRRPSGALPTSRIEPDLLRSSRPRLVPQLWHSEDITNTSFSSNNQLILTSGGDNCPRIWDAATGRLIYAFKHFVSVDCATFSPDDQFILTICRNKSVQLWDVSTGKFRYKFRNSHNSGNSNFIVPAYFSPDCQFVITCWNKDGEIWDTATGKLTNTLRGHDKSINSAMFSHDGNWILTASDDKTVRLWDETFSKMGFCCGGAFLRQ